MKNFVLILLVILLTSLFITLNAQEYWTTYSPNSLTYIKANTVDYDGVKIGGDLSLGPNALLQIKASAPQTLGMRVECDNSIAIYGTSTTSTAVNGLSTSGIAVRGFSIENDGVQGQSGSAIGVKGASEIGIGVYGESSLGEGMKGISFGNYGGYFETIDGSAALYAYNRNGNKKAAHFEGDVQLNGTLTGNIGVGAVKIKTAEGYTNIGALNQWASHFQTDLPQFWFNKKVTAKGGVWVKDGVVRLDNNQGYTQLGYMNQWASHLQTDLPKFWINKQIKVIGDVVTTGDVHAEGTLYAMAMDIGSDKRLKKDVQLFEYGLDEVMQMNPLTYDYNGKGGTKSGRYNVGLFAQDLQEIAPEFVTEFTHQETDVETGELKSEEDYLQIYDTGIKYMLVNATKEQQEIIDDQSERIETLEETLAELRATVEALVGSKPQIIIDLEGTSGKMLQNQPNPFKGTTLIKYNIAEDAGAAYITIYNINGQLMHREYIAQKGMGEVQLQAGSLPAGTYSYALTIDGQLVDTKQMVITK